MDSGRPEPTDLDRIRQLARDLADSDPGPAGELACALAEAVAAIASRVDGLWRLITAVVESAGLVEAAWPGGPESSTPPAEFLQAVASRGSGDRALRLNINNKEWVAAISQDEPPADPVRTWAALEQLTRAIDAQND